VLSLMTFLLFDGNCADAMAFYQSCLGGELTITRISATPMKEHMPREKHNMVAYAHLKHHAIELSATDWLHPTRTPKPGNTVCLYLSDGTYSEMKEIFDRLAADSDEALLDDLREMPFGSYGHVADRFGVHWFFRGEKKPQP
jgi:PhnB protein